jgi:hypothetical protein
MDWDGMTVQQALGKLELLTKRRCLDLWEITRGIESCISRGGLCDDDARRYLRGDRWRVGELRILLKHYPERISWENGDLGEMVHESIMKERKAMPAKPPRGNKRKTTVTPEPTKDVGPYTQRIGTRRSKHDVAIDALRQFIDALKAAPEIAADKDIEELYEASIVAMTEAKYSKPVLSA